ncbi:hypothetical protein CDD83_3132 [Cordyceps sp. RAO-2017]|nr:hypothetical protein CDD83_3132 [Cordyceps sp. RAO-2017]
MSGVTLYGTCAGSGRVARVTKFNSIEAGMERLEEPPSYRGSINLQDWQWETEDEQTASPAVQPPGWPDACSHFKSLEVELKLGSGIDRGTWDDVELCLDAQA